MHGDYAYLPVAFYALDITLAVDYRRKKIFIPETGVSRMACSELIKDISRIRNYMREFFVYGLKSREEVGGKSPRSYDNERRRIESWLGEYMSFQQDANGKNVFISVDSRRVPQNPLYQAWRLRALPKMILRCTFGCWIFYRRTNPSR